VVTYSSAATSADAYTKPYLLLDVRDEGQFADFHLLHARNYPSQLLRRDYTHPEVYNFRYRHTCRCWISTVQIRLTDLLVRWWPTCRNREGLLIIICCDDERISGEVAKVLFYHHRTYPDIYCMRLCL
jgi:rhodanese-related sulfurtransferase